MAGKHGKQAYRENERHAWPAWLWLGLGVLLGLLLSAIMLMKDWVPSLRKTNSPQPNPNAAAQREAEQAVVDDAGKPPTPPKKTFDFYTELPEREVLIPDAELSAKARAEQQRQQQAAAQAQAQSQTPSANSSGTTNADSNARYFLLAGSYTDAKAADEAKAKLALLGMSAKIQPITVNDKVYNRVLVGPYASASETETAKKSLADNGIKSVPITAARSP